VMTQTLNVNRILYIKSPSSSHIVSFWKDALV
jgi:hypothetical protein